MLDLWNSTGACLQSKLPLRETASAASIGYRGAGSVGNNVLDEEN